MSDEVTLTNEQWLEGLAKFDWENELIAFGIMAVCNKPKSWLDIGCGTGAMVRTASNNFVDAVGVDQLVTEGLLTRQRDLRQPLDLGRTFDLVSSIEVAEHIEPEFADVFCDSVVRHIAAGGILVFTAAQVGQGGYHHYNCQPLSYWREKFEARGLKFDEWTTQKQSAVWANTWTSLHHLKANVQIFRKPQ